MGSVMKFCMQIELGKYYMYMKEKPITYLSSGVKGQKTDFSCFWLINQKAFDQYQSKLRCR